MKKPVIVEMVEAYEKVGGPPKSVRLLVNSRLREAYDFHVLSYVIAGVNPRAIWSLRNQLVRLAPDLVHIHGLKADGFCATLAARLAGAPKIIMTIHGSSLDSQAEYKSAVMRVRQWIVGYLLEPVTLRMADAVYCVCHAMASNPRIRRHVGRRLCDTIHNGIEMTPTVVRSDALRRELGLRADDVVMIYTGRLNIDKGLLVLADAMRQLIQQGYQGLKLLLVGEGDDQSVIRARFQPMIEAGHVIMTGRRDDIDALNAASDLFVFPSFHENHSFSLLEAMNAGLPIVATDVGGNGEIVANGATGYLVPAGDAASLADRMAVLIADSGLRKRMGEAARIRLRECFSVEGMVKKTDALFRCCLSPAVQKRSD